MRAAALALLAGDESSVSGFSFGGWWVEWARKACARVRVLQRRFGCEFRARWSEIITYRNGWSHLGGVGTLFV